MGRRSGRTASRRSMAAPERPRKSPLAMAVDDSILNPDVSATEDDAQADQLDQDDDQGETPADPSGDEDARGPEADDQSPVPPGSNAARRRLGRPPKTRPPDWDQVATPGDSDMTPRRRGRGGYRGRGGRKGGPTLSKQQQLVDKDGTMVDIANDECILPEDPEGETKTDPLGYLQGGREYRCRTFTVLGRGRRLYMLSTEPARCVGFRDSYLFFTKHQRLYKIIVDDDEKRDMIEREIIPHSYKSRTIGIVTARSVFREFGARIVVGGRRIIDDYAVAAARAEGAVEGEIADPNDRFVHGEPYNKNQYVAWHGASAVYHTNLPSVPIAVDRVDSKKRHINVNDVNWMLEHAREASLFNHRLRDARRANLNGVYEIHTNIRQYPATMQPTRAVFQAVSAGRGGERGSDGDESGGHDGLAGPVERLPPLPPRIARNFYVTDTCLDMPNGGVAAAAYDDHQADQADRVDQADPLAPFRGLGAVSGELTALLPPDCRTAFEAALARERSWRRRERELESGASADQSQCRRLPVIDKSIVPYSLPLQR